MLQRTCRVLLGAMLVALLCSLTVIGVGSAADPPVLHLLCAAAMKPPIAEMVTEFHKATGIKVECNYGASNLLLAQLKLTNQQDIFLPADQTYMEQARASKLVDTPRTVGYLVPVIMVRKGNPLHIRRLQDLTKPGIRLGMGNERTAAIGVVARNVLKKNKVSLKQIENNTVYTAETISELGTAIKLKHIDATISWSAMIPLYPDAAEQVAIPPEKNVVVTIPVAVVRASAEKRAAQQFIDFATSERGKAILVKHHYDVTPPNATKEKKK